MVDTDGHTTVDGLFAVGEVSCTGVHGANRLASNSLLEGLVFGLRLADGLAEQRDGLSEEMESRRQAATKVLSFDKMEFNRQWTTTRVPALLHSSPDPTGIGIRSELRRIMWEHVSLRRDLAGLMEAKGAVDALRNSMATQPEEDKMLYQWLETENMLIVAELVIEAALQRRESRGSHWRSDFPEANEELAGHHYVFQVTQEQSNEISLSSTLQDRRVPEDETPGTLTKEMAHHA